MTDYLPYINYGLIAALLAVVVFQALRLNKLEDKLRRLDGILATHLDLDPRYTKDKTDPSTPENAGAAKAVVLPPASTACPGCGNAFSCTYPECQR